MGKETRYHIIKEANIDLELLPLSKQVLQIGKGFTGDTHEELRAFGFPYNGYQKTKNGVEYWVLPYFYVDQLDVQREVEGVVVAETLSLQEFNDFGWDVEEAEA